MKILMLLLLLPLVGCDQIKEAPESNGNHVISIADRQVLTVGTPDYFILRDNRNGNEYLVVTAGQSIAIVAMERGSK